MPRIGIHLAADLSLSPPCAARVSNVCHRFRGAAPNMHAGESVRDFHVDMHHAMRMDHRAAIMPPYLHPISEMSFCQRWPCCTPLLLNRLTKAESDIDSREDIYPKYA